MHSVITSSEERMKKTIANLTDEFAVLRTGRASVSLFDKIKVDYYGDKSPLNQVANISIPEARLIVIQPWDKAMIGEIEKAIRSSELSLNPSNDGKVIRISIPPLTEERRKELVKQGKNQAEQSRVAIRNIRRDGNDELKKLLKDGELTEDEESRNTEELQKVTDTYINKINQILEEKEKEIMEV
ncbi:ribosome recycling factor [Breznakiella homolactica]|uniref:Ribosome-recycling factor n=1 Tax=Breznakiella homolactica TaxID=2798577 RepID=A0A7T8B952_9SPIR|nr:ribosome recycling factor [Breznakiella homolactica]QQO08087.1 ribosome recycling factor [Breznakiella homolactica]